MPKQKKLGAAPIPLSQIVELDGRPLSWDEFVGVVRSLLDSRKGEWPALAKQAGVKYRWVISFSQDNYRDVTADMVIRLAQALALRFRVVVDSRAPVESPGAATVSR